MGTTIFILFYNFTLLFSHNAGMIESKTPDRKNTEISGIGQYKGSLNTEPLKDFAFNGEKDTLYDRKLAVKYGLNIPLEKHALDSAPEWVLNSDMFTMNLGVWKGHEFTLKDTLVSRIVRLRAVYGRKNLIEYYPVESVKSLDGKAVQGVSCLSPVPHSKDAFTEAHKQGFKVLPYVHFTDIHTNYADQDVFYFDHPEVLSKDSKGNWIHMPMDGSSRLYRLETCANSPSYWKLSLDYVKKLMDWGADGLFIDNVGERRAQCYAPNFKTRNPETFNYQHEHLFPDTTNTYAWDRMLEAIRALVKSYGNDKVVLLNSGIGTQFQKNGDINEWEGFIYNWAWEGRGHTWSDIKKKATANEWYTNSGRKIAAMSYLDKKRKEVKEDAFWAFSAARLVGFIWWAELGGTGAESLYRVHLGKALGPMKEIKGVAYRAFENGIIVLNDSVSDQDIELIMPKTFEPEKLTDIFSAAQVIMVKNDKVKVSISGNTARVFLSKQ